MICKLAHGRIGSRLLFLALLSLVLLMSSCLSLSPTDFTEKFMDESIPVSEHSVLITMPYISLCYMDNKLLKQFGVKMDINHYYLLTPGEHTLDYRFVNPREYLETGLVNTKQNFVAGHYYAIMPIQDNRQVRMPLFEVTDLDTIAMARNAIDAELNK